SPIDSDSFAAQLVRALTVDGDEVDNLRKAEALSLRRAGVALRLRDMEGFEQDLQPGAWSREKHTFLDTMRRHLLWLPKFFEFAVYFPRIFALAIACSEYNRARDLIFKLNQLIRRVRNDCLISLTGTERAVDADLVIRNWRDYLHRRLSESLAAA